MMIFDTHAHYDASQFDQDRDEVLQKMNTAGVGWIVNATSDVASWQKTLELVKNYSYLYGTMGVHPDCVGELDEDRFTQLKQLARAEKIVAIGEIGLDYHWNIVAHEEQQKWFIRQIELARELQLPVVVHSREAGADTLSIMKEHAQGLAGVLHCFSSSAEIAREYVKMGFYIGIGGVVTFKNGRKLKEVVAKVPLASLVLETDCPYLAPMPYRGKRNISSYLVYVAEEIGRIKAVSTEEVITQTAENGCRLFGLQIGDKGGRD